MNKKVYNKTRNKMRKAIFTGEYAILWAIVIMTFVSMALYLRNSFCGKWRSTADVFGAGQQFDPYSGQAMPYDGSDVPWAP